jgi:His Kinase A (phospho-acceptor) domain
LAHVLIDGESPILADVHDALRRWGMTVGRLSADSRGRGRASQSECDVVLFICAEGQDAIEGSGCHLKSLSSAETESIRDQDGPAPLVVIGRGELAQAMGRQARQLIPEIGPGGSLLKQALDCCLENPSPGGSVFEDRADRDQQLHFLGHELRSPLTAIKTALEVVQGQMWGMTEPGSADEACPGGESGLRMLEIALRNVRRMHHTVEWSQNLLQFEDVRTEAEPRYLSFDDLCRELNTLSGSETRFQGADKAVESEMGLILLLAGEAIQAVRYGDPEADLAVSIDTESVGANRLRLEIRRSAQEWRAAAADQDSDGVRSREVPDFPELYRHLQRFADFLNPSAALGRTGGEFRICGDPQEGIGLALTCDLQPAGSHQVIMAG